MGNPFIYSYRLTFFGGTAPCYEDDRLTLAICKRDMRKMIGEALEADPCADIWVVGIVGNTLAKCKEIPEFNGLEDQVLYIAKIQKAIRFQDYFVSSNTRKDNIYIETGNSDSNLKIDGHFYEHKVGVSTHDKQYLQERDWDIKSRATHRYVLDAGNSYRFTSKKESDTIISMVKNRPWSTKFAPRGHRAFQDVDGELAQHLAQLIKSGHNIKALPEQLQTPKTCKGCGDKKENTI